MFRGSLGIDVAGHDGFRNYVDTVYAAFPGFHNTIEELIVEDASMAARLIYRGTHQGPHVGVAATGRAVEYSGAAIFHMRENRAASGWVLGDKVSSWRQIAVPPLQTAAVALRKPTSFLPSF